LRPGHMRLCALLGMFFVGTLGGCERGRLMLLPAQGAAAATTDAGGTAPVSADAESHEPRAFDAGSRTDAGRRLPFGGTTFECSSMSQCGGRRPYCDTRTRRCVECVQRFDCPSPTVCDTTAERCALPCQGDNDCSMTAQTRCDPNRHVCVECLSDQQCVAPLLYCEPTTGQCVECLGDNQCPPPWRFCSLYRNECVECRVDQDCSPGQSCGAGRCR
jgi:hypothetical protein